MKRTGYSTRSIISLMLLTGIGCLAATAFLWSQVPVPPVLPYINVPDVVDAATNVDAQANAAVDAPALDTQVDAQVDEPEGAAADTQVDAEVDAPAEAAVDAQVDVAVDTPAEAAAD